MSHFRRIPMEPVISLLLASLLLLSACGVQYAEAQDPHQKEVEDSHEEEPADEHSEDEATQEQPAEAPAMDMGDEAEKPAGDEHAEDEAETDAHEEEESPHGDPGVGYIGLERGAAIDHEELDAFEERVTEEAYAKGLLDQARFIFFGLSFLVVLVAFAKIEKLEPVAKRLREAIDWHTIGTVTGIILVGLVIPSGIIITFFYMPTSKEVYSSVEYLTAHPVLAFFRNLHNWSSEIFIWLMILHAARTISTRTFLGNRKFIWLAGALASAIGWVAFLSGSFMRGDQEALEGFEHMMYSFTLVPGGKLIADFFTGEMTIIRLTTLHLGATVFLMGVFLALHILMRKVHVLVVQRWKKAVLYSAALTIFLIVQSILMEAPFIRGLATASTVSGVEFTKPPWPIYFLIQGENWFGANAMVIILAVVFIPLIVLPYAVDLLPLPTKRKGLVGEIAFYSGTFLLIAVSYIAAAGQIQAHIF
jgi:quinol-cytochrome oxidoreductase complex cytochrome b subunit